MTPLWITALACALIAYYVLVMEWQLAGEPHIRWLVPVCLAALTLRVIYPSVPPQYYQGDEAGHVAWAMDALHRGDITGTTVHHVAGLLIVLFAAVPAWLVPALPLGAVVRGYSVVTSALSPAAAYMAVRACGGPRASAWTAAALLVVLPWSLWYGRSMLGGELIFHELLLLTMCVRLVHAPAPGWRECAVGSVALTLLLYDYTGGAVALALPLIAGVCAPTARVQWWTLAMLPVSLALWWPNIATNHLTQDVVAGLTQPTTTVIGVSIGVPMVHPGFAVHPVETALTRTALVLYSLVAPVAEQSGYQTLPAAAMHPVALIGCALVGVVMCAGWRVRLVLLGFYAVALLPGILSNHWSVSTHRTLLSLPLVTLAIAHAVAVARARWVQWTLACAIIALACWWSLPFVFADCGGALGTPRCDPDRVTLWRAF